MSATTRITIRKPDDWHLHIRDGAMLAAVLPFTAHNFQRAIVMPNLVPPVTTTAEAAAYRARVLAARPRGSSFTPLMTCYLRDDTDPDDVERGFRDGVLTAVKFYPAHATTNSAAGVSDLGRVTAVLERMQKIDMPLLLHGEVTDPDVDIFDREKVFIERTLTPLTRSFPGLRIVLEHLSTREGAGFVMSAQPQVAGTITPGHLSQTRNDMLSGGIRPHLYAMPILKTAHDREALRRAATSGAPCYFLGTDSAPHTYSRKVSGCGAAGMFSAPVAIETYATVFDEEGALDRLEAFASVNGPAFYRLPPNTATITLEKSSWTAPEEIPAGDGDRTVVYRGGEKIAWQVVDRSG